MALKLFDLECSLLTPKLLCLSSFKYRLNPKTPKFSLEILLTFCHTVLMMLVRRIRYWIN